MTNITPHVLIRKIFEEQVDEEFEALRDQLKKADPEKNCKSVTLVSSDGRKTYTINY